MENSYHKISLIAISKIVSVTYCTKVARKTIQTRKKGHVYKTIKASLKLIVYQ